MFCISQCNNPHIVGVNHVNTDDAAEEQNMHKHRDGYARSTPHVV